MNLKVRIGLLFVGLIIGIISLLSARQAAYALTVSDSRSIALTPIKSVPILPENPIEIGQCITAGCSGQLCVEAQADPLATTCEWREEYACYRQATCERQQNGACGWTMDEQLTSCLGDSSSGDKPPIYSRDPIEPIRPIIDSEPHVSACNGVCDEDDICQPGTVCIWEGKCPADCEEVMPPAKDPAPTCFPRPSCLDATPRCLLPEPQDGWCPQTSPMPTNVPEIDLCTMTGGSWDRFSNGCADLCTNVGKQPGSYICTQATVQSCECGADSCWTGTACIPNAHVLHPIPTQITPRPIPDTPPRSRIAVIQTWFRDIRSRFFRWNWK